MVGENQRSFKLKRSAASKPWLWKNGQILKSPQNMKCTFKANYEYRYIY